MTSTNFNSYPQPKTFAPSREDVLTNLQYFFGAPVSPEKLKDYSEHHAATYHFPGARTFPSPSQARHTTHTPPMRWPAQTPTTARRPRFATL